MVDRSNWMNCDTALRGWAEEQPDHIAFIQGNKQISYASLEEQAMQVASALLAAGLTKGDRIAWLGKNSTLYFILFFGAARTGIVLVPVGWRLADAEVQYILEDTGAKMLFTQSEFVQAAINVRTSLPELGAILTETPVDGFPTISQWMADADIVDLLPLDDEDDALQLYTSGTTGKPKGAVITNRNFFAPRIEILESGLEWANWSPKEIGVIAMPVGHIAGTGVGIMALFSGCTSIIIPEFSPDAVLDAIDQGATNFFLVPTALQMIVNHPRAKMTDFSKLEYVWYGAAPIPLELLRQCIDCFGAKFCQQYGMTETTGTFCYLPPEDHDPAGNTRMRSAGLPLPGVEVRICDDANNVVSVGDVGEIVTRSALNMKHYWKNPEKTAETVDADGWLHTGDAGYMDKDGYVFIHDRVKDMIISGGENVYPAEVENAVFGHPDVLEVAVIGIPDEKWGEAVKAVVVPKPGCTIDEASVIAYAREQIAAFKAPKTVDVIPEMPRNATGKILRRELRDPYWEGVGRKVN